MRYTLWLDGHLLGETRLQHRTPAGSQRLGALIPTPYGMEILPGLCGFLSAATEVKACMQRHGVDDPARDVDRTMRLLESTPEGERFRKVVSALGRLELRQSGGERAAFHTVIVTDSRELRALAEGGSADGSGECPRFIVSATPLDVRAVASHLHARAVRRARLEPS